MTTRQSRRSAQPVPRYALTRQEAAASLGMSVDTFERRVQPFIMVVPCGQLLLVPPAEIERWIKANARYLRSGRLIGLAEVRVQAVGPIGFGRLR